MLTELTERDLQVLEDMAAKDYRTLAIWHCRLNSWEWPQELPDPETEEERKAVMPGKQTRAGAIMRWIEKRVGARLISFEWNCFQLPIAHRMTPDEHEDFWRAHRENDPEAKARDVANRQRLVLASLKALTDKI